MDKEAAQHTEKLLLSGEKNYTAITKSTQDLNELLRILIVNTLREELEASMEINNVPCSDENKNKEAIPNTSRKTKRSSNKK